MHRCWTFLSLAVAMTYLPGRAAAQVDADAFFNLPDSQKLQVIGAAMDQREARLQRMSYDVVESVRTTDRATGETVYGDDCSHYFARDGALQRQETRGLLKKDQPGAMVSDISVWDGKRLKALTDFNGLGRHEGTVKDTPTAMLNNMHYHNMLGLRAFNTQRFGPGGQSTEPIMTLGEWVREVAQSDYKVTFGRSENEGRACVDLAVEQRFWTWNYRFDPARGWMPVRYERVTKNDDPERFVSEVVEAREVNGVWVPALLRERGGYSKEEAVWEYRLKEFKTGADVQAEFDFLWPPNTLVADLIARVGYRIKADGSVVTTPFIDSQSGQLFDPAKGSRPVATQAASLPVADRPAAPATRPVAIASPTAAATAAPVAAPAVAGWLSVWRVVGVVLLAAGAVGAVRVRKRRIVGG